MRTSPYSFGVSLSLVVIFLLTTAVSAAEAPVSKCVTAGTSATHAAVVARMEKDIAPYLTNEKATSIVQNYREAIDVSWNAMQEPYCGFGVYGIKSAVKSYTKSTERARLAFTEGVKGLAKGKIAAIVSAPKVSTAPAEIAVEKVVVPEPEVKAEVQVPKTKKYMIMRGLSRGMKSNAVSELQNFLADHFKIEDRASIVTGFFGPKTEQFVIRYQVEAGIISSRVADGAGIVGPKTASKMSSQ